MGLHVLTYQRTRVQLMFIICSDTCFGIVLLMFVCIEFDLMLVLVWCSFLNLFGIGLLIEFEICSNPTWLPQSTIWAIISNKQIDFTTLPPIIFHGWFFWRALGSWWLMLVPFWYHIAPLVVPVWHHVGTRLQLVGKFARILGISLRIFLAGQTET